MPIRWLRARAIYPPTDSCPLAKRAQKVINAISHGHRNSRLPEPMVRPGIDASEARPRIRALTTGHGEVGVELRLIFPRHDSELDELAERPGPLASIERPKTIDGCKPVLDIRVN